MNDAARRERPVKTKNENKMAVHDHAPGWGWCCTACVLDGPLVPVERRSPAPKRVEVVKFTPQASALN